MYIQPPLCMRHHRYQGDSDSVSVTLAGKGSNLDRLRSFVNLCLLNICPLLWVNIFILNYFPLRGEQHQCPFYRAQSGGCLTPFSLLQQPQGMRWSRAGHGREAVLAEGQ